MSDETVKSGYCPHIAETIETPDGRQEQRCARCGLLMIVDYETPVGKERPCRECGLYFEPPADFPDLTRCWECDPEMDRLIRQKRAEKESKNRDS